MEISAKGLRTRVGEILACVERGEVVTVTYRGKPRAKLVRIEPPDEDASYEQAPASAFGMWEDRTDMDDVDAWVRDMRKERFGAS